MADIDLLVVGSIALDSVETPSGSRSDVLGGSATFLAASASFFCRPGVVGVVGEDFPPQAIEFLRSRNVDTSGIVSTPGKTFRWHGRYHQNMNDRTTLSTCLNVFETFKPQIPETFRRAPYVVLGNIDPDLQRSVLEQVDKPKLVACDTMNYWIDGARPSLLKTLSSVDVFALNDQEARLLAQEDNLVKAAKAILRMGPRLVVIKRGEHGALLFMGDSIFAAPALPLETVVDPTGAGDAFAGAMIGFLAQRRDLGPGTIRQSVIFGSVLASFVVEDFSLERLRTLSSRDIQQRFALFQHLTQFDAPMEQR